MTKLTLNLQQCVAIFGVKKVQYWRDICDVFSLKCTKMRLTDRLLKHLQTSHYVEGKEWKEQIKRIGKKRKEKVDEKSNVEERERVDL